MSKTFAKILIEMKRIELKIQKLKTAQNFVKKKLAVYVLPFSRYSQGKSKYIQFSTNNNISKSIIF